MSQKNTITSKLRNTNKVYAFIFKAFLKGHKKNTGDRTIQFVRAKESLSVAPVVEYCIPQCLALFGPAFYW